MTISTRFVSTAEEAQAVLDEVIERNSGLNSTPEAGPLVAIPGGFTADLRWGEHGAGDLVVIPSAIRHWHVTNAAGDVAAVAASRIDASHIKHRDVGPGGCVHTCWAVDPCDLRPCPTCASVAGHFPGCPDVPEAVELRYVVKATYQGEPVYLSAGRFSAGSLLLNVAPVSHPRHEADHLAQIAREDPWLSHVVVDQDPQTTGMTPETVISGLTWHGSIREAIHATPPEVCGTVVEVMEAGGRLPQTDEPIDLLDVVDRMSLDDVRLLLDDPGALVAVAQL